VLALTPAAVQAVVDVVVRENPHEGAGLRIAPGPRSAGDQTYTFAVEAEPLPGDVVVEEGPARIFLDADAAPLLDDRLLDAHVDEDHDDVRLVVLPQS
jgi:Fe-S cluster assembly iron-binding protein IscA